MESEKLEYWIEETSEMDTSITIGKVNRALIENRKICFHFYSFPEPIEESIRHAIYRVLNKYQKEEYSNTIYSVVFESTINGLKANAKKLFFIEQGLNGENLDEYERGMTLFKTHISKSQIRSYGKKNKEKNIFITVTIDYKPLEVTIEVINDSPLLKIEEQRIKEKLQKALNYPDLMTFYTDNYDPSEGEGLGLALSLILLKGDSLDPNIYKIENTGNSTTASITLKF